MMHNKLTQELLYKLYIEQNLSSRNIAKQLGVNKTTILKYLKKFSISKQTASETLNLEQITRWYLQENLSTSQIAEKVGVGATTIKTFLKKNNISKSKYQQIQSMSKSKKFNKFLKEPRVSKIERRNLSEFLTYEVLKELYVNKKLTVLQIASQLEVSEHTVSLYMRKFGIKARGNKLTVRFTYDLLYELYVEQSLSSRQVAKKLGVSQERVLHYLKRFNIPIKDIKLNLDPVILEDMFIAQNMTITEIANTLKIGRTTVQKYLSNYGVTKDLKVKDKLDIQQIKKFYLEENWSSVLIAEKFGVSPITIRRLLKEFQVTKGKELQIQSGINTNTIRYGVENLLHVEGVQDKVKATNMQKLGVEYPFQSKQIQQQIRQNRVDSYGAENPMEVLKFKEKFIQNFSKKYGVTNPAQVPEFLQKMKDTCMKHYGVPFYVLKSDDIKVTSQRDSLTNHKWEDMIKALGYETELEYKIDNRFYDIHIKGTNILVEINPTATHNTIKNFISQLPSTVEIKDHYNKSILAHDYGFHCIHIWDWDNKKKVLNLLKPKAKIQGRKTEIKIIDKKLADVFNNNYHLQNTCNGQEVIYGLYYESELVSLMSFGKPRYNKNYQWELLRYTTHPDYMVLGGAEKLFKHFIKDYKPETILTYCDYSKFSGQVYEKLGFKKIKHNKPSCRWSKGTVMYTASLINAMGFDKVLGKQYGYYGKGTNNQELMLQHGFVQIYDCGQLVFEWHSL